MFVPVYSVNVHSSWKEALTQGVLPRDLLPLTPQYRLPDHGGGRAELVVS